MTVDAVEDVSAERLGDTAVVPDSGVEVLVTTARTRESGGSLEASERLEDGTDVDLTLLAVFSQLIQE